MTKVLGYGALASYLVMAAHVYLNRPFGECFALYICGSLLLIAREARDP